MEVLERDEQRPALRDPLEQASYGPENLGARRPRVGRGRDRLKAFEHDGPVVGSVQDGRGSLDSAQVGDHLLERPERDTAPVRQAAARGDVGDALQLDRELAGDPRLSDSGRAQDRDDAAPARLEGVVHEPTQRLELPRSVDQRHVEAPRVPGGVGVDLVQSEAGNRFPLPSRGEPFARANLHRVLDERVRRCPDEDRPGLGGSLQSLGEVHRVAGHEPLAGDVIACDDLTRVDADAAGELDAPPLLELEVQLGQRALHLRRRAHRAKRVVLVRDGDAEDGHHLVAAKSLDRPSVLPDDLGHRFRVARHDSTRRLGVGCLSERGRADDIAEEDRDGLPDLEAFPDAVGQRGAARAAESRAVDVRLTATVTFRHRSSLGRRTTSEKGCEAASRVP